MSCEAADGGGEIDGCCLSEPVEGCVAERRQVLGSVAAKDGAAVLVERGVAHVMHAVFDRPPVVSHQGQQSGGIGAGTGKRRDVVGRLDLVSARPGSLADDPADLFYTGPADVMNQRGRGGDGPRLDTTVALVRRACGALFSSALSLMVGGKRPPGRR